MLLHDFSCVFAMCTSFSFLSVSLYLSNSLFLSLLILVVLDEAFSLFYILLSYPISFALPLSLPNREAGSREEAHQEGAQQHTEGGPAIWDGHAGHPGRLPPIWTPAGGSAHANDGRGVRQQSRCLLNIDPTSPCHSQWSVCLECVCGWGVCLLEGVLSCVRLHFMHC